MSLGAIDFGMIVDGAVVMMENSVRRLGRTSGGDEFRSPSRGCAHAAHEVARPIVFAVAIIIAVYMPIFFLEGLEGRMFRPMAITVCSALLGVAGPGSDGGPHGGQHRPSQGQSRSTGRAGSSACATLYTWCSSGRCGHRTLVISASAAVLAVSLWARSPSSAPSSCRGWTKAPC